MLIDSGPSSGVPCGTAGRRRVCAPAQCNPFLLVHECLCGDSGQKACVCASAVQSISTGSRVPVRVTAGGRRVCVPAQCNPFLLETWSLGDFKGLRPLAGNVTPVARLNLNMLRCASNIA